METAWTGEALYLCTILRMFLKACFLCGVHVIVEAMLAQTQSLEVEPISLPEAQSLIAYCGKYVSQCEAQDLQL